ncbi:MAG: bifunctional adenosylcobinamide kinase/adenosylcobinamide-phosphate guanylyltransferase [bacterium]|nr:bifunctional adenosylcobinamide kinase/adenosylcobinamide-phosphate guanylyltransferase [bacterium]
MLLVTGGSGSGKSAYAEQRILDSGQKKRFYIATMQVYGEEGRKRVVKHRKQRAGKGFETIEQTCNLGQALESVHPYGGEAAVLVECLSNLAANELFLEEDTWKCDQKVLAVQEKIREEILAWRENVGFLVVVTNEIFSDGVLYDASTRRYQQMLGELNQQLCAHADEVVEVVYGIVCPITNDRIPESEI